MRLRTSSRSWRLSAGATRSCASSSLSSPSKVWLRRSSSFTSLYAVSGPSESSVDWKATSSRSSEGKLARYRSEEHTSELQSHSDIVCRLLLEKKKIQRQKL